MDAALMVRPRYWNEERRRLTPLFPDTEAGNRLAAAHGQAISGRRRAQARGVEAPLGSTSADPVAFAGGRALPFQSGFRGCEGNHVFARSGIRPSRLLRDAKGSAVNVMDSTLRGTLFTWAVAFLTMEIRPHDDWVTHCRLLWA
jgi:hypothetical protein